MHLKHILKQMAEVPEMRIEGEFDNQIGYDFGTKTYPRLPHSFLARQILKKIEMGEDYQKDLDNLYVAYEMLK